MLSISLPIASASLCPFFLVFCSKMSFRSALGLQSTMLATPILGNKVLQHKVRRLSGIVTGLVPIPKDDISNVIASFDMPDDTFYKVFGFLGSTFAY